MSRGNRREDIFLDDVDRQDFLKTLAEACQKTDWQVHAYCLMRNHLGTSVATIFVEKLFDAGASLSPWRVAAVAGRAWRAKPDGSEWGRPAAGPLTLPPGDLGW